MQVFIQKKITILKIQKDKNSLIFILHFVDELKGTPLSNLLWNYQKWK